MRGNQEHGILRLDLCQDQVRSTDETRLIDYKISRLERPFDKVVSCVELMKVSEKFLRQSLISGGTKKTENSQSDICSQKVKT